MLTSQTANNKATSRDGRGGALLLDGPTGYVSITDCTFQNNSAGYGGGAVFFNGSTGYVSITDCTFQNNSATSRDGRGGAVLLENSPGYMYVSITDCTFQSNRAGYRGGAVVLNVSIGYVNITNCTFQNNRAVNGGAGSFHFTYNVYIRNCTFLNNRANFDGGAVHINLGTLVIVEKSTLFNNNAVRGAAVYASNTFLTLQEVIVEKNYCSCNGYPMVRGGAIYFNRMTVRIIGDTITGSQFLSNSPLGAIIGEDGLLQLYGNVSFYNNTGENGGAISLSNSVRLYFNNNCTVEFFRNFATVGYGGAIYIDRGSLAIERPFSFCSVVFITDSTFDKVISSITFRYNHAQQGGHAVYATPIYRCNCIQENQFSSKCTNLTRYFTITPLPEDLNDIQVLSFPTYVQLCNCSDPDLCNHRSV